MDTPDTQAAPQTDLVEEILAAAVADTPDAEIASDTEPADAAEIEPAAVAPEAAEPVATPGEVAEAPLDDDAEAPSRNGGRVLFTILGVIAALYLAGVSFFSFLFLPQTTIGGVDVSLKTQPQAAALIATVGSDYTLAVKGKGLDLTIGGSDVALDVHPNRSAAQALSKLNAWRWPLELAGSRDLGSAIEVGYDKAKLVSLVQDAVGEVNLSKEPPVDAFVGIDEAAGEIVVIPEVPGTRLATNPVVALADTAIVTLAPEVEVGDSELVQPTVTKDDPELLEIAKQANALASVNITVNLDGESAYTVGSKELFRFIDIEARPVAYNDAALEAWAADIESSLDSVGDERTYKRPDGKEVTVKGGTYGWKTKSGEVAAALLGAVREGKDATLNIDVVQRAARFAPGEGGVDWGRYIDVDLAQQHARFYDEGGKLLWESPIVTGRPGMGTPTGVWRMNKPLRNVTLVGRIVPATGEPEYRAPVSYWLPFVGTSIGFHDANWQARFGGSRYVQGFGSHGCVNLPYSAAQSLYSIAKIGDVVIVHW